ncbi:hypothetical protein ABID58_003466 [Bradyrhizobium sp. S3.2.6]
MTGQEHMGKTDGLCAGAQISLEACPVVGLKKSEYFSMSGIAFFD